MASPVGLILKVSGTAIKSETNRREFTTVAFTIPDLYTSMFPTKEEKAAVFKSDSCPTFSMPESTQPKAKTVNILDTLKSQSETKLRTYHECPNCKTADSPKLGLSGCGLLENIACAACSSEPCPPCPGSCSCNLPPPCNTPPKCLQYMTGYYYYPYGTWFCGPYHVNTGAVPYPVKSPGVKCCCGVLGCNLCFPPRDTNQRQTIKDQANVCSVCFPGKKLTPSQIVQGIDSNVGSPSKQTFQSKLVQNHDKGGNANAKTSPQQTYQRQMAQNQCRGNNMKVPSQEAYQSQMLQNQYRYQQAYQMYNNPAQMYQNPFYGWNVTWDPAQQGQYQYVYQGQTNPGAANPATTSPQASNWLVESQPRENAVVAAEKAASFLSNTTDVAQRSKGEAKLSRRGRRGEGSRLMQTKPMENRELNKMDIKKYKEQDINKKDINKFKEQVVKDSKLDYNRQVKALDFKNLSHNLTLNVRRVEELDEENLNKSDNRKTKDEKISHLNKMGKKKSEDQNVRNLNKMDMRKAKDQDVRNLNKSHLNIQKGEQDVKAKAELKERPNYCEMLQDPKHK